MENHPIPQDVTGFKFKLIGSVTVKQFLYILGGGILTAVTFMLPISAIIRIPLCFLFAGVGTALAFVPIEGRPMDIMMKNFLKALPRENQYIFKKRGAEALITEFFTPHQAPQAAVQQAAKDESLDARRALLYKTLRHSYKPDDREEAVLTNINTYLNESTHSASPPMQNIDAAPRVDPVAPVAAPTTVVPRLDIKEALKIVTPTPIETPMQKPSPPVTNAEPEEIPVVAPPPPPSPPPSQAKEPVQPHVEKAPQESIPQQATPLKNAAQPKPAEAISLGDSKNVTPVTPEASLKAGFPELPDTPNIVMGIVKDPRGRVMPNILVEIMDTQGIPVRAFKTNALGQFAAATPLPNGEYNVLLEDPRKQGDFEQIKITLDGTIFNPLEIISVDQRERLRRELFGGAQTVPQPTGV